MYSSSPKKEKSPKLSPSVKFKEQKKILEDMSAETIKLQNKFNFMTEDSNRKK